MHDVVQHVLEGLRVDVEEGTPILVPHESRLAVEQSGEFGASNLAYGRQ